MLKELDADIAEHIERETQDNLARGMTPEEARYAAVRKFGTETRVTLPAFDGSKASLGFLFLPAASQGAV